MSETTIDTANAGEQANPEAQEFKAPATQEELDRIIQKRVERERSKFNDYDDLKAKASRLTEIEESSKSELQKAQERAEAAEKALAETRGVAVRAEVAAAKGVPVALLAGDSREALEASADALLAFRDETARKGNFAPSEGRYSNTPADTELREFTRNLFANQE